MDNYIEILRHEFEAGDESFLIKMRVELEWDREAFSRLTEAIRASASKFSASSIALKDYQQSQRNL